jgi:hypothetical protein
MESWHHLLLAAMSRGRRLLYTIPAITPCMQRKIIIYVYEILTQSLIDGHAQGMQIPAITLCMQRKIIIYLYGISTPSPYFGHGAQVVVHHPSNHTLHAAENYHLFIWNLDTISLLAAMSRGRRLLYTIPAITPGMQRKIVIHASEILTQSVFGGHAQGVQIPAITLCMQWKIVNYLFGILTPSLVGGHVYRGAGCCTPSRQSHPACSGNFSSIYMVS